MASDFIDINLITIEVSPNLVRVGDTVTYQITGDDLSEHTFRWRFGDGIYADGPSVSHTYLSGGVYNLVLVFDKGTPFEMTITYDALVPNYDELRVVVSDVSALFTVAPNEGYPPLTAAFEDISTSTLGLTGWEWAFTGPPADPFVTGETGPVFVYDTAGVYYPYLRVTDLEGYQDFVTGMITVYDSGLDISTYKSGIIQSEPVSEELPVSFQFRPVLSNEGSITSWKWELIYDDTLQGELVLEDQETGLKSNFDYTFTVPAEYKVRLTVIDNDLNVFSKTETVTITENISISASPLSGNYPLSVAFSISNAADPDPYRITNDWDFTDDGTYDASTALASHTYSVSNVTTCRLRLAWELVDKYTTSKKVEIELEKTVTINVTYPSFTLGMIATSIRGRRPLSVLLRGYSNNPVTIWSWEINGVPLVTTSQAVRHTFSSAGIYVVTLTASDSFGQGPLTVQKVIQVSSILSTIDKAVDPSDASSILIAEGSEDIVSLEYGVGFRIPPSIDVVEPSGFTTSNGISIIFD